MSRERREKKLNVHKMLQKLYVILQSELIYSNRYAIFSANCSFRGISWIDKSLSLLLLLHLPAWLSSDCLISVEHKGRDVVKAARTHFSPNGTCEVKNVELSSEKCGLLARHQTDFTFPFQLLIIFVFNNLASTPPARYRHIATLQKANERNFNES